MDKPKFLASAFCFEQLFNFDFIPAFITSTIGV